VPYFVTDSADGCSGWATIKEDGEVMGCHTTKQAAIDQMVAISISEDIEPGGERTTLRVLPDNYRPSLSPDVPEGRACGNCFFYDESNVMEDSEGLKAWCERWDDYVLGDHYCNAWQADEEVRQVNTQNIVDRLDAEAEESPRSITMKGTTMTKKVEHRVADFSDIEMRASEDGLKMTFRGYAAVFDSPSEPLPFIERIAPGAFKRSLRSRNEIKMFVNHNMDRVLGSTRAGTLRLSEDEKGLLVEADLPNTTDGRDLSVLLERGDVSSMSFGFTVPPKGDKWSEDGMERTLTQVRLHEVSVVTGFPAYEATTASVRNLAGLALRTNVDGDKLADALTALESGATLTSDQASVVREVVGKLEEPAAPTNEPDNLNMMRKQLDLLFKAV
jgi:HK97 family phage prohead protease